MIYFAYGSNMSLLRLRERAPDAQRIATCTLLEHDLRFHKISPDGSAKCDSFYTGNGEDRVLGAVYELGEASERVLDRVEGLGRGYDKKSVSVVDELGREYTAFTYYATLIDPRLQPYGWYLQHVLVGARELGLPEHYLRRLEAVGFIDDPDLEREARQRALYL
ncbi:gamma-glutamylcyclotransferase family protein [Marinobacterium mangrovicola]|uniref:AIG2 family protein n=1 Tax=Marinobacterium mangrovicola TaxID=1476959 RepID=A0A4R1GJL6_9GAMM|nr:gamma-glutamylcyclotransferase family protein [Marinobacterium mangrovicola]TCK08587.1 AIG2 family protein [Marinobacterium mangrovicola]